MTLPTNSERSARALVALDAYGQISDSTRPADRPTNFRNMITDLMHYADQHGLNFSKECLCAKVNFDAEKEGA